MLKHFKVNNIIIILFMILMVASFSQITKKNKRFFTVQNTFDDIGILRVSGMPEVLLIDELTQKIDKDAKLLVFRQSTFAYFSTNKFISHFSATLIPAYEAGTEKELLDELRVIGITHLYIPPYSQPEIENTQFKNLLMNPGYADLVAERDGYRVYALNEEPNRVDYELAYSCGQACMSSLKNLSNCAKNQYKLGEFIHPKIIRKHISRRFFLPCGGAVSDFAFGIQSPGEYIVELSVQGEGRFTVSMQELGFAEGKAAGRRIRMKEALIDKDTRNVAMRYRLDASYVPEELVIEMLSTGSLNIEAIYIKRVLLNLGHTT